MYMLYCDWQWMYTLGKSLYIGECVLIRFGEAGCLLLRLECCGMLIGSVVEYECLNWFKFLQIDV